jgi:lysozyme
MTGMTSMAAPRPTAPSLADLLAVSGSDAERRLAVSRAFSGLGSDPALLSLLAHLGKSRLNNEADADSAARKAAAETQKA